MSYLDDYNDYAGSEDRTGNTEVSEATIAPILTRLLEADYVEDADTRINTLRELAHVLGDTELVRLTLLKYDSDTNRKLPVGDISHNPVVTLDICGNDAIAFPMGTNAERPSNTIVKKGMMRFNLDNNVFEGYNGIQWSPIQFGTLSQMANTFLGLADTPGNYGMCSAGEVVIVNETNNGLKFGHIGIQDLSDVSGNFGSANQILKVNSEGTHLVFANNEPVGTFESLSNTPASLGTAGQIIKVNSNADGLEFIDVDTSLNNISTNPVENQAINTAINLKQNLINETTDLSVNNLFISGDLSGIDASFNDLSVNNLYINSTDISGLIHSKQDNLTFGISSGNAVKIHTDGASTNNYAMFDTDGIKGRTISQVKGDLSIDNVDNTADINKPISTLVQNALDTKQELINNTIDINVNNLIVSGDLSGADASFNDLSVNNLYINSTDISGLINSKQDNLTFDDVPTNSSNNPVKSGGVFTELELKAPLANPTLTGIPLAPTASTTSNDDQIATTKFVQDRLTEIVNGAPGTLDTLNELAAALGDDANFSTTITTSLALKAPLDSPSLTGTPIAPTATPDTSNNQIATTSYVKNAVANVEITTDNIITNSSTNPVQSLTIHAALANKQDNLTFDDIPISGSNNPVKSDGIFTELGLKAPLNNANLTGIPTAPTATPDISNNQIATTSYVRNAVANVEITTDNFLSNSSTNPVQNQTITSALASKQDNITSSTSLIANDISVNLIKISNIPIHDSYKSLKIRNINIVVDTKTEEHPYFNEGSENGYIIDGQQSPTLTFIPGVIYRLHQSDNTNVTHPIRFYLDSSKTTIYEINVSYNGVVGQVDSYTEIIVSENTPSTLYYQCLNHSLMGGVIYVSNSKNINDLSVNDMLIDDLSVNNLYLNNIDINSLFSEKQNTLIAGTNINIIGNTITATQDEVNIDPSTNLTCNNIVAGGNISAIDGSFNDLSANNIYLNGHKIMDTLDYIQMQFDERPIFNSINAVRSGGIYNELQEKHPLINTSNYLNANLVGVGNVSNNEFQTLHDIDVTKSIQTQIDAKLDGSGTTIVQQFSYQYPTSHAVFEYVKANSGLDSTMDVSAGNFEVIGDSSLNNLIISGDLSGVDASFNNMDINMINLQDIGDVKSSLDSKAPLNNPTFTGTVSGVTATHVGLGNVTNESKTTMFSSPTFTGTVSGVTAAHVGLGNVTNESKTTMFSSPTFTGTVSGVTAAHVGLGNVTNESKTTMFSSPTFTGTVSGVTAAHVGLGNVTNESKTTMFSSPTFTGTVSGVTAEHVGLGNVTNESKTTMFSNAALTGTPTAPTANSATNNTQIATTSFVSTAINNLIDSAPGTLNTLNELAAALGDDANFSTTITNSLTLKAPLASPALTGTPTAPTPSASDNSTQLATTAYVTNACNNVSIAVDTALSSTSTNPVENQVIHAALANVQGTLTFSPVSDNNSNPSTSAQIKSYVDSNSGKWTSNGNKIYYNTDNVGIGTNNPSVLLDLRATAGQVLSIGSSSASTSYMGFYYNGSTSRTGYFGIINSNGDLGIDTESSSRPLILQADGNGKVGIGTYSPDYILHLEGTATNTSTTLKVRENNASYSARLLLSNPDNNGWFAANNGYVTIQAAANAGYTPKIEFGLYDSDTGTSSWPMMINSNSRVGIGTYSPDTPLHVYSDGVTSGGQILKLTDTNGACWLELESDATGTPQEWGIVSQPSSQGSGSLEFYKRVGIGSTNYRMTLDGSGNVGIGVRNPIDTLEIKSDVGNVNSFSIGSRSGYAAGMIGFGYKWTNAYDTADNLDKIKISPNPGGSNDYYSPCGIMMGYWSTEAANNYYTAIGFVLGDNNDSTAEPKDKTKMLITRTGRVGIGTVDPDYTLDVVGDINLTGSLRVNGVAQSFGGGGGSSVWSTSGSNIYYSGGKVGIGNTNPEYMIDITSSDWKSLRFKRTSNSPPGFFFEGSDANYQTILYGGANGFGMNIQTGTSDGSRINALTIENGGNVGIGTLSPGATLDVSSNSGTGANAGLRVLEGGDGIRIWRYHIGRSDVGTENGNGQSNGTIFIQHYNTGDLICCVGGGNVGIKNSNPAYALDVTGDINFTGTLYQNGSAFSGGGGSSVWSTNGNKIYYNTDNVGIGTTSPNVKLEVYTANTSNYLRVTRNDVGYIQLGAVGSLNVIYSRTMSSGPRELALEIGTTRVMTLDNNYNVGIGTTSPDKTLHLYNSSRVDIKFDTGDEDHYIRKDGDYLRFRGHNDSTVLFELRNNSTGSNNCSFPNGYLGVGYSGPSYRLHVNGTIQCTSLIQSSDMRIKNNIVDVSDNQALELLRNIPCRYYEYIDKKEMGNGNTIGFIAQEVKELFPMAVKQHTQEIPDEYREIDISNIEIIYFDNSNNIQPNQITDSSGNKQFTEKYKITINDLSNTDMSQNFVFYTDINHNTRHVLNPFQNPNTFIFDISSNYMFLYGKEIDDFHALDKSKLFALNFSATQEIDKQQQADKLRIAALEAEVANLKTENTNIKSRLAAIEAQLGI